MRWAGLGSHPSVFQCAPPKQAPQAGASKPRTRISAFFTPCFKIYRRHLISTSFLQRDLAPVLEGEEGILFPFYPPLLFCRAWPCFPKAEAMISCGRSNV